MADAKKPTAPKKKTTTVKSTSTAKSAATKTKPTVARKTVAATAATPKKKITTPKVATKTVAKQPFMSMQPTRETTYWLIFSLLILALGIWVLTLTIKINDIYDQIEVSDSSSMINTPTVHKHVDKTE